MANIKFTGVHKSFGANKIIKDFNLLGKEDDLWESHQAPSWDNHFAFPDGKKDAFIPLCSSIGNTYL